MKQKRLFIVLGLSFLIAGSTVGVALAKDSVYHPTFAYYTNHDADTYYSGISDSLTGNDLLSALRSLNKSKRKSTVGYESMGTTASGMFRYTDYDPSTVKYDSNNQPYGTKVLSFYSGNSTGSFNREHVWPQSHGGKASENDIHMPRPTIASENGSRGNSFFVEGKKSTSEGWDPAMESFGKESYRGDAARIIFYCMLVSDKYQLVELDKHATTNANPDYMMGRLSHMVKWNLQYSVAQREQNRNEGAEYLQGNRNPFIDHPEYVCKIWGNTNDETRRLCGSTPTPTPTPTEKTLTSIELTKAPSKVVYGLGDTLSYAGMKVTAIYSDSSKADVTSKVTTNMSTLPDVEGTYPVTLTYKEGNISKTVSFNITVGPAGSGKSSGCSGNIITTSVVLSSFALAGITLILINKRKKEEI